MNEVLAVTGDRREIATFEGLIGPHLDAGYQTALAILRDHEEAHDAVQEAAVKAWRKLKQLKDGRSARSWFLKIVANQYRSTRRTLVGGDGSTVTIPGTALPLW